MPSAVVDLTEENDHFINLIKAHMGLRNKSDAINFVVSEHAKETKEPELRPEYVRKLKRIMKHRGKVYSSVDEMMDSYK